MSNILVPFPHMALNAVDVPPPDYLMFNTWKVDKSFSVDHMVGWIRKVAIGMPGGKMATLVFNAHGSPGSIEIGQGIRVADLNKFEFLKTSDGPLIKSIWIVACRVAGKEEFLSGGPDGESFCKDLAMVTGSRVTAGVRVQIAPRQSLPIGYIDAWEGEVGTFRPDGTRTVRQAP